MKPKTAIAISGGVDSLTTAFLLKQEGHEVLGIHFITGFETDFIDQQNLTSESLKRHPALDKIKSIENQLNIPIKILDCRKEFREQVVQYFNTSYLEGKTPNPCLICNPHIKFGVLLKYAKSLGASQLATGHYVKKQLDANGVAHLFKGDDPKKDQSYFLAFLAQEQLADACFPLGSLHKTMVKEIAKKNGLEPVSSKESQDICFIHGKTYADFLMEQGIHSKPGIIVDKQDKIIGEHKGLHHFTVGQRRGINCPAPTPYYVLQLDIKENRLIVGDKQDLLSSVCTVEGINWLTKPLSFPISCEVKIRYQHKAARATIDSDGTKRVNIRFENPQLSITPGQGAVFYIKNKVIGGGWIAQIV
jgi:tRNA-specific 2-thiouridylase